MAVYLDETKTLTMYKGQYRFPIDPTNRMNGSLVYLMTPNMQSSISVMNSKNAGNNSYNFQSYFLEKNVEMIINKKLNEDNQLIINGENYDALSTLQESLSLGDNDVSLFKASMNYSTNETHNRVFFNDFVDEVLNEDVLQEENLKTKYGQYNLTSVFKKMLYSGRLKNQQEVMKLYEKVKEQVPQLKYTFVNPSLYKNRNLFYDLSYYTELFFQNKGMYKGDRALDLFGAFVSRFLSDNRFGDYTKRTIIIPFDDWAKGSTNILNHEENTNPISLLYRSLKMRIDRFTDWKKSLICIISNGGFFTFRLGENFNYNTDVPKLINLITRMARNDFSKAEFIDKDSKLVIMNHLALKLANGGINITNLVKKDIDSEDDDSKTDIELKRDELVDKLDAIADKATTMDDAEKELDTSNDAEEEEKFKELLLSLQAEDGIKMDKARADRYDAMQKELLKKQIRGKKVSDIIKQFESNDDIPETALPIDSIDDHWKHVKFPNFNEIYTKEDMQADIVAMFKHFTTTTHPMNIISIDVENTSTSEDYVDTWTVQYEDAENGKRSTVKVDIPRMIGSRFMKLRGNEKVLIGQLMLLPIEKTDRDTVQIVSNYNKIFIRRKSPSGFGKSTPVVNKIMKVLSKWDGNDFKVIPGDNSKVSNNYVLPVSFIDLASLFSTISFKDHSYISFNMDNLSKIPIDRTGLPKEDQKLKEEDLAKKYLAIYVKDGKRIPIPSDMPADEYIKELLGEKSDRFKELYAASAVANRLMFSEASILNMTIPVIVVAAYTIGLQKVLNKVGIKYEFSEKRPAKGQNYIKFNDGYMIYYPRSDADNMLMNGMMQFDTTEYSIGEINSKDMWLGVLDDYGGRIKADGLDNFADLMMDPITVEICKILHIPHEYIDALLYASSLLTDTKFNRHSDITGNRLRVNEVIVAHLYSVLAKEYGAYRNGVKRNKGSVSFTCKKSAVIDSILTHDQTSSDLSTLSPLLEAESAAKVTFKGLSGMNSERAFSMEKRTYDESMLGVLSLSTGFAGTVGINRQTTIDAGVRNKRGFITPSKNKDLDNLSTFSIMEAMTPLAVNRDDPMRTAMGFTQTVQHQMMIKKSMPNLITTGADQALPYLTSNKFSYKFKGKRGTVKEVTDQYIVLQDDDTKECDYIDLRETIQKNSDGGFYITTKLDPNVGIKKGSKIKYNDIVAYNKSSYSPSVGNNGKDPNDISYNIGTLAKVGILNTAMGFEDSCVVDHTISEALAFELVVQKDVSLASYANVFHMVEVGQEVQEGEPLIIFSDTAEEEDAAAILKSLTKGNEILSDIGRKKVHAKVSGIVQDIKVYRTVEMNKLSDTLQHICKKYESKVNKLKKVMRDYKIDKEYELEPSYKLPQEGKLKNLEGVRLEFYLKTVDKLASGDKIVYLSGLKGVVSTLIPKGEEATSEYRPNEYVSAFLTSTGVFGRMVSSCMTNGLINKGLIELARQAQQELGIKPRMIQEILMDGIEDEDKK